VELSAHEVAGQFAVHTLLEFIAKSAGISGHSGTQVRVEKSANFRGD
jgi:hypothetical protein